MLNTPVHLLVIFTLVNTAHIATGATEGHVTASNGNVIRTNI